MGGVIADGARNITVRNSAFTGPVNIGGSGTDGIVFDANTHNWNVGPSSGGANAKIYLENSLTGTLAAPSVTVQNSEIKNGDLDGIHFGGGSGYQIVGNRLENLCDHERQPHRQHAVRHLDDEQCADRGQLRVRDLRHAGDHQL